jgi:CHASE2 domain-containing sensor protein/signal transduction histidine kinase
MHPSGQRILEPLSLSAYDRAVARLSPGASNVTVIAIDEASLAQLGRWPWRRAIHAALIEKLDQAKPAVVGLDILFSEPSDDDSSFAAAVHALSATAPVVFAAEMTDLSSGRRVGVLPTKQLVAPNSSVAHVGLRLNADGVVRSLMLREGGLPAFSLAVAGQASKLAARRGLSTLNENQQTLLLASNQAAQTEQLAQGTWRSEHPVSLPFGPASPEHQVVSYGAVLRGEVPVSALRDKIVLVGATANGLGDTHATPALDSRDPEALRFGVLIHAQATTALLNQRTIRQAPTWINFAFALLFMSIVMAAIFKLSAGRALAMVAAGILLSLGFSLGMLWFSHLWVDPSAALVMCALAYPLWSWRRLKAAVAGLAFEAETIALLPAPWPKSATNAAKEVLNESAAADPLGLQLTALAQASEQLRLANRFYSNTLNAQAHPVLVIGARERIVFANNAANIAFSGEHPVAVDANIIEWMTLVFPRLSLPDLSSAHLTIEHADTRQRDWLISLDQMVTGVEPAVLSQDTSRRLLQLVDISALRAAQRERDEAMRFLSHDIRSPQVALINWVAQERKLKQVPELALKEVELRSMQALEMADAFLMLARAETQDLAQDELSMSAIADEAVDAVYGAAKAKGIRITQINCEQDTVIGDAGLLRRALINLISNALNYGPAMSQISVVIRAEARLVIAEVCDQGQGVPLDEAHDVFKPYFRGTTGRAVIGNGLGLPFVKTVAQRHRGQISIARDVPNYPSVFRLSLPAA